MRIHLLTRVALILGASSVLWVGGVVRIEEPLLSAPDELPVLHELGLTLPESQTLARSHFRAVQRHYEDIADTPQFRASLELDATPTLRQSLDALREREGAARIVFEDPTGRVEASAEAEAPAARSEPFVGADGTAYAVAVVGLAADGLPSGRLVVVEPVSEAMSTEWRATEDAARSRARGHLIMKGVLALLAALIASVAFWRVVVAPLRELASTAHRIGDGEFATRVGTARSDEIGDLSRAVDEMAERLERHDQTLSRQVSERTVELAAAVRSAIEAAHAAEQAQRVAEEASQAKSRFLANMSHELRTPMNGVLGLLDVLLQGSLTVEQRRMAETALRSGKQLVAIVEELLDFSRIEAGRLTLDVVDFDLRLLVDETLDALCVGAHEQGVILACLVDDEVPTWVRGDPTRLRQVLTNLMANGIKFSETGTVLVQVESRALTAVPGREWRIGFSVSDEGLGIAESEQKQIFEAFEQVDDSMTRRSGGAGLGLAISRAIVEAMGGCISVKSSLGEGSRFTFDALLGRTSIEEEPWRPRDALLGRRLVALSASPLCRRVVGDLAGSFGLQFTGLEPGAEAAEKLGAESAAGYDFAVVDVQENARELDAIATYTILLGGSAIEDRTAPRAPTLVPLTAPLRAQDLYRTLVRLIDDDTTSSPRLRSARERLAALGETPSILVVEDNPVNRGVAVAALATLGFEASCAEHGRHALELLAERPFHLVLMDCQMPVMDGLEATRAIRERERSRGWPRTPIIALTAHALPRDRQACVAAGMDGFLTKPLSLEALAQQLAEHLDAASIDAATPPRPPRER